MRKSLLAIGVVLLSACGMTNVTTPSAPLPTPTPPPPGPPTLLVPETNAVIPQNDRSTGCGWSVAAGRGFRIDFGWAGMLPPAGLARYDIYVQHQSSTFPMINDVTTVPEYHFLACGSYVADQNLAGWVWKVRAVDQLGQFGPWAERPFSFGPCIINGKECGVY